MKLSVKALALTAAILWGGCILLTGIVNLVWSGYGVAFLDVVRSIYPGYAGTQGVVGLVVGTLYGVVDGAVCGALFAWLYNRLSGAGQGNAAAA
ncbi:MAG TPA: hypothetical protein VJ997_12070 [Longimicrobiales bacterium]|nr:hypothetical protein [Longimicrobiales bacterium]